MGPHDLKHNKVPLFARKPGNVNVLRYAAPKLALVPESRYNCDVNNSFLMYVSSFIRIERGLDGAHEFKHNDVPLFAQ